MTRSYYHKPVTPLQGIGSRLLSWTSAALIVGLTWGFGYVMYLLLLKEMAG